MRLFGRHCDPDPSGEAISESNGEIASVEPALSATRFFALPPPSNSLPPGEGGYVFPSPSTGEGQGEGVDSFFVFS
jgi:hypothetical protein